MVLHVELNSWVQAEEHLEIWIKIKVESIMIVRCSTLSLRSI